MWLRLPNPIVLACWSVYAAARLMQVTIHMRVASDVSFSAPSKDVSTARSRCERLPVCQVCPSLDSEATGSDRGQTRLQLRHCALDSRTEEGCQDPTNKVISKLALQLASTQRASAQALTNAVGKNSCRRTIASACRVSRIASRKGFQAKLAARSLCTCHLPSAKRKVALEQRSTTCTSCRSSTPHRSARCCCKRGSQSPPQLCPTEYQAASALAPPHACAQGAPV